MPKRAGPIDELVGMNIRIFRKAKGLSQARLGSLIGVTFQQIQKYEKGANRIGPSRLAKIAKALEVPIGRLFDTSASSSDGPVDGEIVTDLLITPYAVQMLKAFAEIRNDHLSRNIAELTESLAEIVES
jgi:transcriptional regulator with XRE-family HTH domain